jgi:PAS domain S-box-containing protein
VITAPYLGNRCERFTYVGCFTYIVSELCFKLFARSAACSLISGEFDYSSESVIDLHVRSESGFEESSMLQAIRSAALRYGLALVSYAVILLITFGVQRLFSVSLDLTSLIIAVMIASAWYGGTGPGLLVAILFELTLDYFGGAPHSLKSAAIVFNRLLLFGSLVLFASSRRRAENRLRQQREWLRVTLSSIGDAVIATDVNGSVSFINPTAEAKTGWTISQSANQPFDEVFRIINEDTREPVESPFSAVIRQGAVVGLANHTILITKDGREIPIEDSGAPIKDAAGNTIGVIVVFHDVSERRRAEQDREQLLKREQAARSEAEAANRLKDEFLATVSHELRTPLNAILGWAAMLNRGKLEEETARNALRVIERNARAQAQIIDDILDVSRIIIGKLRIESKPIEIAPIIQAAIDTMRPAAAAKAITLRILLDDNAGLVSGDSDRLQQIIWNLLSNAIKFTPRGGWIEIRLARANSHIEIRVSDNGIGVDKQFLPYVFERFRQADSSMTREHTGLGLGLAIVRHLVELHGGTVSAESAGQDQGAVFIVQLPIAHDKPSSVASDSLLDSNHMVEARDISATAPDLTGLRVLVVDDEPDAREILSIALSRYGAEVRAAASSAEALEAFLEWKPDVLISDLGMPGEDGFALIRKVRALTPEQGGHIPAAALTAYVREEDRFLALSAGYETHIPKPVDPTTLAAAVAGMMKKAKKA